MNLREGTRRLALLLGVVGAILGGIASYLVLQPALEQRARHNRFEQLANSDVVKQERKAIQVPGFGPPEEFDLSAGDVDASPKKPLPLLPQVQPAAKNGLAQPNDWQTVHLDDNGNPISSQPAPRAMAPQTQGTDSKLDKKGIKAIHWTENYGIESIETEDGQTLYPTPAPSTWQYLLIALLPILGFFIPWGAVRAIGWVGAGFVASGK